jgi:putative endonuclease
MKPELYILQLSNGKYYIGSTANFHRRISEHQNGKVISTKSKRPIKVVFRVEFDTLKQARQVEYKLKSYKNRNIIARIVRDQNINFLGS